MLSVCLINKSPFCGGWFSFISGLLKCNVSAWFWLAFLGSEDASQLSWARWLFVYFLQRNIYFSILIGFSLPPPPLTFWGQNLALQPPGWPWTCKPPTPVSRELSLQTCVITLSVFFSFQLSCKGSLWFASISSFCGLFPPLPYSEDWTQGRGYASQVSCHWTIPSVLPLFDFVMRPH